MARAKKDLEETPDGEQVRLGFGVVLERESLHRWTVYGDDGCSLSAYLVRKPFEDRWSLLSASERDISDEVPGLPCEDMNKVAKLLRKWAKEQV